MNILLKVDFIFTAVDFLIFFILMWVNTFTEVNSPEEQAISSACMVFFLLFLPFFISDIIRFSFRMMEERRLKSLEEVKQSYQQTPAVQQPIIKEKAFCRNCGAEIVGTYCVRCGTEKI